MAPRPRCGTSIFPVSLDLNRLVADMQKRALHYVGSCWYALAVSYSLCCIFAYTAGEIHSDWREVIAKGVADKQLPITLTSPNTSHEDSDDCGAIILGMQEERPNWDMIGAKMNQIRTQTAIKNADVVVVRFGEKYRQWNAAFDAGYAAALGKPIITLHPPAISHMLKGSQCCCQCSLRRPRTGCADPSVCVEGRSSQA